MQSNVVKKKKLLSISNLDDLNDNLIMENSEYVSVGEKLRRLRKEKRLSIKDIAGILRISEHYLHAIENMDSKMLPERVYSLGFVRSYALFLGLDYQEAVTQFKNEIYGNHRAEPLSVPGPILETSRANWKVILICTAIVGVVILAWYKLTQKNNDPEPTHTAMQIQDLTKEEQTSVEDSQSTLSELHSPLEVTQKSVIVQSLKPKTQTSNIPLSSISGEQTPKR